MPERIDVESLREVAIYLNQIMNKLEEMEQELATERSEQRDFKSQRNFVLIASFVAPIVLTFVYNAAGLGKL